MAAAQKSLKDKPSERDLTNKIAKKAGGNWRALLTNLGLEETTITQFLNSKLGDTSEACFKGLTHWLGGNADKPVTWEKLLEALRDSSMVGIADNLEKELKSSPKEEQNGRPSHSNPPKSSETQWPVLESQKEFMEYFQGEFLADDAVNGEVILEKLANKKVISKAMKKKIAKEDDDYKVASAIFNHMRGQGDYESIEVLCECMMEAVGEKVMNKLGKKMMDCLKANKGNFD